MNVIGSWIVGLLGAYLLVDYFAKGPLRRWLNRGNP